MLKDDKTAGHKAAAHKAAAHKAAAHKAAGHKTAICIVNPFEHGGGAEYQISLLIDALVASGAYDVHYLTHVIDERERNRNYQVSRIGAGGAIPRMGYLMEARPLYAALREINPGVIYQRVACGYTGVCAAYAQRRSVPLIWHASHDTEVTSARLDAARNVLRVRLEKWAVGYGIRRATRIVVQTRHQADLLQANFRRKADAIIANFHPAAAETLDKSGPLTVVWIANLKPWKRPDAFVRLARGLSGYADVRFIMVGAPAPSAGNEGWQDSLMRSIETTENLRYLGRKSHEEVNELLGRSHVFVNTSTHEGFPNTFIQSWLRDVAVVSLQVDPDQVLEREQVGIAAHSEAGLLEAVRRLIENPAVRAQFAARGRAHASLHHSLRNAEDLVRLINSSRA
jgi:glycosyltransferase involved in cell wall biosynthesis